MRRVVDEVIDDGINAVYSSDPKRPQTHQVELSTPADDRRARLRATYEWLEVSVPDLGVDATLFEYDDNEPDKESVLRELALVARAYLRGDGSIEYKRGVLGRRPLLTVTVNGREW